MNEEYLERVRKRLLDSLNERDPDVQGRVEFEVHDSALMVSWEPGDMTRYRALLVVLRSPNGTEHAVVSGTLLGKAFYFECVWGGFLSLGYFLEKCPAIRDLNLYTQRKLCQLVAACVRMDTDANQPVQYE